MGHHGELAGLAEDDRAVDAEEVAEIDEFEQAKIRLAICTNTLAEGVNLPLRTLVLYSVHRRQAAGPAEPLLARDIKNLVGRAGRPGSTTKGLVICANENQWPEVQQVARQVAGEPVRGALRKLMERLQGALAVNGLNLTNPLLESTTELHTLIDGIDATLVDLASDEIGEDALVQIAVRLADETFAAVQAVASSKILLRSVFELRARRVIGFRAAGRIAWIRETGARPRMLDAVESRLFPSWPHWHEVADPLDPTMVATLVGWAWDQGEFQDALREALRSPANSDMSQFRQAIDHLVTSWLAGDRYVDVAVRSGLSLEDLLGVHARVITFVLQTLVEQAVALLAKLLEANGQELASAVAQFPDHLRFGVPTEAARILAARGVRHRCAAVALGGVGAVQRASGEGTMELFSAARQELQRDVDAWSRGLGALVVQNTLADLTAVTGAAG
ncbi:MAG: hypothetical protein K8T90_19300 [Planctomycetes bacterium]|nr:hypothetical protein [Planctomycetota bacterium]